MKVVTEPVVTGEWGGVYLRRRRLDRGVADVETPPMEAREPRIVRALALAMMALTPAGRPYLRKLYEVVGDQRNMLELVRKLDVPVLVPEGEQSVSAFLAEVEGMSYEQWLALLRSGRVASLEWGMNLGTEPTSLDELRAILERAPDTSARVFSIILEHPKLASDIADGERRALLARGLRSSIRSHSA